MNIVTRQEWGARHPKSVRQIVVPTPELWLHHTATGQHGAAGVRAIQRFHMDTRGWQDIAYSYLVDADGTVYEGRGPAVAGAHTHGHNSTSHAICAMGDYQQEHPTERLVRSVARLVRYGHDRGWWPATLTGGHRDVGTTACPGQHLYARIDGINRLAAAEPPAPEEEDVNAPPLVKKAGDPKVWVGLGDERAHLADAVWKAMDPRDHTKIRTLPDDDPFWDLPVRTQSGGGSHRHEFTIEASGRTSAT